MSEAIEKVERKTVSFQNIVFAIVATVTALSPVWYAVNSWMAENEREKLVAAISEVAVTKADFLSYVDAQMEYQVKVNKQFKSYFFKIDSTLILVLPAIIENQSAIYERVSKVETKVEMTGQSDDDKYESLLKTMVNLEARRETERRHREIVTYLKELQDTQLALPMPLIPSTQKQNSRIE